jgi:hypothetical protein
MKLKIILLEEKPRPMRAHVARGCRGVRKEELVILLNHHLPSWA